MVGRDGRICGVGQLEEKTVAITAKSQDTPLDFDSIRNSERVPRWVGERVGTDVTQVDVGHVAVLPGLTNAHTHLELAGLRGRIPPCNKMPNWAENVVKEKQMNDSICFEEIEKAVGEAWKCGTALVGDISNTMSSLGPLSNSRLGGVIFKELIGFDVFGTAAKESVREAIAEIEQPLRAGLKLSLSAHAPYSVSLDMLSEICAQIPNDPKLPYGIHLAESVDEVEFFQSGTGAWRGLLEKLGRWPKNWSPPGHRPVHYLEKIGFLGPRLLATHGVVLQDDELERLAHLDVVLVTCPRSNVWTGAGEPPIPRFYAAGGRIAVGTDSLASSPDMNLFSELEVLRRLAPNVSASRLLRSATLDGAQALGFGSDLGSIELGKLASLIAVDIPDNVDDVEEYLVSGLAPDRVRWLESVEWK